MVEEEMVIHNRNFVQSAGDGMFTTVMHCSSIIFELFPYSNAFFCRPLWLSII